MEMNSEISRLSRLDSKKLSKRRDVIQEPTSRYVLKNVSFVENKYVPK